MEKSKTTGWIFLNKIKKYFKKICTFNIKLCIMESVIENVQIEEEYEMLTGKETVKELRDIAKGFHIKGRWDMTKPALVEAIGVAYEAQEAEKEAIAKEQETKTADLEKKTKRGRKSSRTNGFRQCDIDYIEGKKWWNEFVEERKESQIALEDFIKREKIRLGGKNKAMIERYIETMLGK